MTATSSTWGNLPRARICKAKAKSMLPLVCDAYEMISS